ncbi:MAG: geranylgeranyl reductase family protein [Segniliparus sp.]|uniref:geranylgeranyl reductase family protein n=1 Tax=Segniliparus sp. TaxID=2804064 RepID=UPI003F306EEE
MDGTRSKNGDETRAIGPEVDVLVVGAGPAGSAAAAWAARAGRNVLLVDMAEFPRDKTCGDGLTPRAIEELDRLGLSNWVLQHPTTKGVHVFFGWEKGQRVAWPKGSFPRYGSVVTRTELDHRLTQVAEESGASLLLGHRAHAARREEGRIVEVELRSTSDERPVLVKPRTVLVADGVRSRFGALLGRQWHRDTVYGTAVRAFMRVDEQWEWLVTHLGLSTPEGDHLPGYGWLFPLGDSRGNGEVDDSPGFLLNVGVILYAAAKHPANTSLKPLLDHYLAEARGRFGLRGEPMQVKSALLPLGGAVSPVAGPNWMLLGDAAGCVNPFTGEGIDYALETGRFAVEHLDEADHSASWPHRLNYEYGSMFSASRRIARGFFKPKAFEAVGGAVIRSPHAMDATVRLMANLVSPSDKGPLTGLARIGGTLSQRRDAHRPFFPLAEADPPVPQPL